MKTFNEGTKFSVGSVLSLSWRTLWKSPAVFLVIAFVSQFSSDVLYLMWERVISRFEGAALVWDAIGGILSVAVFIVCQMFFPD